MPNKNNQDAGRKQVEREYAQRARNTKEANEKYGNAESIATKIARALGWVDEYGNVKQK